MKLKTDKFINKYKIQSSVNKIKYYKDLFNGIDNLVDVFTNNSINLLLDTIYSDDFRVTYNDISQHGKSSKFVFDGFKKGEILLRLSRNWNSPLEIDGVYEVIDTFNDSNIWIGLNSDGKYLSLYKTLYQVKSTFYIHENEILEYANICKEVQETGKKFRYNTKRVKVGEERNEFVQELTYEIK